VDIAAFGVQILSSPRAEEPELRSDRCVFQCLGLKLAGSARLGASAQLGLRPILPAARNPIGVGWRIGWVQVNVQEWRWALFSGAGRDEAVLQEWPGTSILDTADDAGRDIFCSLERPFYQVLTDSMPGAVEFVDMPISEFPLRLGGGAGNGLLSAIGLRLSFVCALAARAPDDALFVLSWVPWYVQWSYDFAEGAPRPVAKRLPLGTKAGIGPVQSGCPDVLTRALTAPGGASANVAAAAPPNTTFLRSSQVPFRLQALRTRG
jgi:hypothetical protein